MDREDDELIQRLSSRIAEEVENLPKDGQDHELRIKIKGNRGNINLGTQSFEIVSGKQPPPPGSDRERHCPQCGRPTWRYTQLCMHCDYDLHLHDRLEAEGKAAQQRERHNMFLLKACIVCVVIAGGGFWLKKYLPEPLQSWMMGLAMIAGLLAFLIMQATQGTK